MSIIQYIFKDLREPLSFISEVFSRDMPKANPQSSLENLHTAPFLPAAMHLYPPAAVLLFPPTRLPDSGCSGAL